MLWQDCHQKSGGMFHCCDGAPQAPALLHNQAELAMTLVSAYHATSEVRFLDRAKQLAEFILAELKNPGGGFYDIPALATLALGVRLTLIEQNGAAATFFCKLAHAAPDPRYQSAARHALSAFTGEFDSYGVHAAPFGSALQVYLSG